MPALPFSRSASLLVAAAAAVACMLAAGAPPAAARAEKDADEVRARGSCSAGASAELRLKSEDEGIELRLDVDGNRAGALWRVALVHERRVVWKGSARATRSSGAFRVRRLLRDLPGYDTVSARAWGPRGLRCRATATLPGA